MEQAEKGSFTIKSYLRSEITPNLVHFIQLETEKNFNLRRSNYNYKENYIWDESSSQSLAFKFKNSQFDMINLVFQNDEFLSFSGTYLNKNEIAFGGGCFRVLENPDRPAAVQLLQSVVERGL